MLDICLLGTGGMMPLPYRWLTSMMARCGGSNLLIDCGEGTQIALKEKGWSPKPIDVICFTHYHADHISGLPGLLLTMGNAERTEPLTLVGPKGLERVVGALRTIAPELPFELRFIELAENRERLQLGPYVIDAYRVNHNVICYGYAVSILRTGRFDVDKAREGNPHAIEFPRGKVDGSPYDFSFSGLKSAVLNHINHAKMTGEEIHVPDLVASFQNSVVDSLVSRTVMAAKEYGYGQVAIAGGVASNTALRAAMEQACNKAGIRCCYPSPVLCTDNAAMIGAAAYYEYCNGNIAGWDLNAVPNLKLGER